MDRSHESRLLALVLGAAAAGQLARRRVLDSMVPDVLSPLRREIEVASSSVQLVGAASLCVPALRQVARWANVCVHVGVVAGALDSARHPDRFRRSRTWSVGSLLVPARIPIHVAAIGLILWVTRSRSAPERFVSADAQQPIRRDTARPPAADIDRETPSSEQSAEEV